MTTGSDPDVQQPVELAVLDHLPQAIVVLDRDHGDRFIYHWVNRAATQQFGVELDDVRGKTPAEAFPGRTGQRLMARQHGAAADGRPRSYEYPLSMPRGEVWIATHLSPVKGPDGMVTRLIATMRDITAQRAAEAEQFATRAELRSVESEVERYVAMAAHDLRTPMSHVAKIAELLRDGFVDYGDGKLELIDLLEEIGSKASSLITDVLSYARATTTEPRVRRVSLAALSEDLFAILDPQQRDDLVADDVDVETDDIALQIVLSNLIDNAIKHAGTGSAKVRVEFLGASDGMLDFAVCDGGRGFDDPSTAFLESGEFKYGSGFGLLGIRRMIEARDGAIWAEALPPGQGARVRFRIPGHRITAGVDLHRAVA